MGRPRTSDTGEPGPTILILTLRTSGAARQIDSRHNGLLETAPGSADDSSGRTGSAPCVTLL